MANHTPKAGTRQPKTILRECNSFLTGSGMVVRDWQRDSLLEPLPLHKRFTLELTSGDDWNEIPDLHALLQQLQQDAAKTPMIGTQSLAYAPSMKKCARKMQPNP